MDFAQLALGYMEASLVVSIGLSLALILLLIPHRRVLIWTYTLLLTSLAAGLLIFFVPQQVWQAPQKSEWTLASEPQQPGASETPILVALDRKGKALSLPSSRFGTWVLVALLVFSLFLFGKKWVFSRRALKSMIDSAYSSRRFGQLEIHFVPEQKLALSFRYQRRFHVLLPYYCRLSLKHELQHHRQGDTSAVYVLSLMEILFFWNPLFHLFKKRLSEFQEFACDEALVDQQKVSPQAYGRCLLEAAQNALRTSSHPNGSLGLTLSPAGKTLERRIRRMLNLRNRNRSWKEASAWAGLMACLLVGGSVYALNGVVHDRRVTMEQAENWAGLARKKSEFPLEITPEVLRELQRYVGTADGRRYMKESLARMKSYQSMIEGQLGKFDFPQELMAIALIESGFRNLEAQHNPVRAAGLWQFIPQTARSYGMRVSPQQDDRLDPEIQTHAALKYLKDLKVIFNDWKLTVMSYNSGERQVLRMMKRLGTRDAWKILLAETTAERRRYLAKFMAGAIILHHPEIVE